ncbi:hypothetical protein STEG23_037840 [Scotinomys teguina]
MTGHLQRCSSADVTFPELLASPLYFKPVEKLLRFHSSGLKHHGMDHEDKTVLSPLKCKVSQSSEEKDISQ